MSDLYQIKCRYSWKRKQIEVFVDGCEGVCPPLTINPNKGPNGAPLPVPTINDFPTPKQALDNAIQYAVLMEAKNPQLHQQLFFKEQPFKMGYYMARNAYVQAITPKTPKAFPAMNHPRALHTCNLKGGTSHEGGLRLEGIPDVIGTFSAWKTWEWDETNNRLRSPSHKNFIWEPLQVIEAKCDRCPSPPCTNCSCGIYAGTEEQAGGYGEVLGLLKQWGRFVEGSTGYKSQFAYPQEFHLKAGQEPLIEKLQIYGVPIKIMTMITAWDPRKEGFTTPDDTPDSQMEDNDDER